MNSNLKIFSGTKSKYLAEKIVNHYGQRLGQSFIQHFSDGEYQPGYTETVRGDYVFIIQSTFQPSDNLFELLLMIDAAKRASAYKIIAVIPYMGFARQDRKDKPRVAIGSKLVADLITAAGVDRVMTMDLHADQIQGFFDVPVDHLFASAVFVPYIKAMNLDDIIMASPDTGGTKRANAYSKFLDCGMVICYKSREKANVIGDMQVIGDVSGKNVILIDDIIDTAGTITTAANMMSEQGAKSVIAFATHPVLSGPAYKRINDSAIDAVYVTDTIPLKKENSKIKVLSVAELFSRVIKNVYKFKSISSQFISSETDNIQ
ncbi:MAG: ribose-phosphate pyrophosphokinase [Bacteroidota bacterium]|nr:ribose-phosphate pyrophosphokinase [Bacteroidota bacterium]